MGRRKLAVTDDHIVQLEKLAGYGLTMAAMAHIIGMAPTTMAARMREDQRIGEALERGKALAEQRIGQALYNVALDPSHRGQMTAIIWWEKTRAGRIEPRHESTKDIEANETLERFKVIVAKLEARAAEGEPQTTVLDCEHRPAEAVPLKRLPA